MITVRSFGDWVSVTQDGETLFEGHKSQYVDYDDILHNFDEVEYEEVQEGPV